MARKRFDADWLAQQLMRYRFSLNLPEVMKGGISFVRASSVDRLYEHVLIRTGQVAYAETVISAATFTSCKRCVSETDGRFRTFLAEGDWCGTTLLRNWAEAREWQERLIENADAYCNLMTREKGQLLYSRLQPVLNAVHLYVQALGDMNAVFDREFAFVSAGDSAEKEEVNRLATLARSMLYLNFEDATLASIALVRFGTHVENRPSPFQGKVPHRDDGLATRLVLLTDFVRAKRLEYNQMCGLRL